jgi:CheY-like chemotaxis protein
MDKPQPTKILLAEDEEIISMAYQHGLTYLGYEVVVAQDGLEAIQALQKQIPDILLLDIIMPNMNGIEVLQAVRTDPAYKKLPIIMLTNLSQPSDEEQARELGASDYMIKSNITLTQLVERIESILHPATM